MYRLFDSLLVNELHCMRAAWCCISITHTSFLHFPSYLFSGTTVLLEKKDCIVHVESLEVRGQNFWRLLLQTLFEHFSSTFGKKNIYISYILKRKSSRESYSDTWHKCFFLKKEMLINKCFRPDFLKHNKFFKNISRYHHVLETVYLLYLSLRISFISSIYYFMLPSSLIKQHSIQVLWLLLIKI